MNSSDNKANIERMYEIITDENVEQEDKIKNIKEKREKRKENREKKEKKKNSKFRKVLKIILLVLLLGALAYAIYFKYNVDKNGGGVQGVVSTALGVSREESLNMGTFTTLLVGTSQENTDTILLATYHPKTQEASLLSIPRDTFVGDDVEKGKAKDKINMIYRLGGIEELLARVKKITGVDVKNYIIIDTKALIEVVDVIGGVWYDVPIDMNYHDSSQDLAIELQKGYQKLDGAKAEGLVRFRHNDDGSTYPASYGIEDHGRNRTQREFIKETLKQTVQFHNIDKIFELMKVVNRNIKTNIDFEHAKKYVPAAMEFNPDNIKQGMLPGKDVKTTAWFYLVDKIKTKEMIFDLFVFSDDERKIELKRQEEEKKRLEEEKKQKATSASTSTSTSSTTTSTKTKTTN